MKRQGFTIAEILLGISLILVVVILAAPRMQRSVESRTEIKAAAMSLMADLRYLRQRAVSLRNPTALVIPSLGLTKAHCQGYILKEGLVGAKTLKVADFKRLYKDASVFVGLWEIDTSLLKNPALGTRISPIDDYVNSAGFTIENWSGGSKDYIFLFTPEGSVLANPNMPNFDNAYHIVVGKNFTYTMASLAGASGSGGASALTALHRLTAVWTPAYTITITPSGEIALEDGVAAMAPALNASGVPTKPGEGASLPALASTNNPPVILMHESKMYPKINERIYPPSLGLDAVVSSDDHLRIVVVAQDPDGDHLFLNVKANPDRGVFSTRKPIPMEYDPATRRYKGLLEWFPPDAPNTETEFTFSAGDRVDSVTWTKRVRTTGRRKIAFISNRKGSRHSLYVMNMDGSCVTQVPFRSTDESHPTWSPDRGKIIFESNRQYSTAQIWAVGLDGMLLRCLSETPGISNIHPSWSPDGSKVAFATVRSGIAEIFVMNADGSSQARVESECQYPGHVRTHPTWNSESTEVVFSTCRHPWTTEVRIYKVTGIPKGDCAPIGNMTLPLIELTRGGSDDSPSCSPDGRWIAFTGNRGGGEQIYLIQPNGSHPDSGAPLTAKRLTFQGVNRSPSWTPDSKKIIFESERDGNCEIYSMDLDGTHQLNLTDKPGAKDEMPCASW